MKKRCVVTSCAGAFARIFWAPGDHYPDFRTAGPPGAKTPRSCHHRRMVQFKPSTASTPRRLPYPRACPSQKCVEPDRRRKNTRRPDAAPRPRSSEMAGQNFSVPATISRPRRIRTTRGEFVRGVGSTCSRSGSTCRCQRRRGGAAPAARGGAARTVRARRGPDKPDRRPSAKADTLLGGPAGGTGGCGQGRPRCTTDLGPEWPARAGGKCSRAADCPGVTWRSGKPRVPQYDAQADGSMPPGLRGGPGIDTGQGGLERLGLDRPPPRARTRSFTDRTCLAPVVAAGFAAIGGAARGCRGTGRHDGTTGTPRGRAGHHRRPPCALAHVRASRGQSRRSNEGRRAPCCAGSCARCGRGACSGCNEPFLPLRAPEVVDRTAFVPAYPELGFGRAGADRGGGIGREDGELLRT